MAETSAIVHSFVKGGIFPVYKPKGLRTMQFIECMKERWKESMTSSEINEMPKVGHGGVLDHFAHGVIVVGIGRASCRNLEPFTNNCQKRYIALGKLGEEMDTDAIGGNVIKSKDYRHVTQERMQTAINRFRGEIRQRVPLYSNIRVQGRRMVEYAAAGIYVKPKVRKVHVYSLDLLHLSLPYFEIEALCSSGTYIRSMIRDIGAELGTAAYTHHLCRVEQGPFKIGETLTLQHCDLKSIVQEIANNGKRVKDFLMNRRLILN